MPANQLFILSRIYSINLSKSNIGYFRFLHFLHYIFSYYITNAIYMSKEFMVC